jgi:hypothetical protein
MPRVDAALCVLDASQPFSESERDLILELAARVPRLLVVLNKIDLLADSDRDVAARFVGSALRDVLGNEEIQLFVLSARTGEGLAPLVDELRRIAADERATLLTRSAARLARGLAADTTQAARFEARAIELPLHELATRAHTFEERIQDLTVASTEAGELLDRGIQRTLREIVNEPLMAYADTERGRLLAALHEEAARLHERSPRDLSGALAAWIDATVRAEFSQLVPQFETAIADELTELQRRYAARVGQIIEQVQRIAADVFGERAGNLPPDAGLRTPSRFSFKLTDAENALDIIVGFGRTITPGALGRRLVVRDAEQRLLDMADRHAGRLRSELAERATAAARDYRRELAAAADGAIGAIRVALDRAHVDRQRGALHARARLDELAEVADHSERLALSFDRWLGAARS